jgi:hypothetical protein
MGIPPLRLTLKGYFNTGIFYIPKILLKQNFLVVGKKYKLEITEVKEDG